MRMELNCFLSDQTEHKEGENIKAKRKGHRNGENFKDQRICQ